MNWGKFAKKPFGKPFFKSWVKPFGKWWAW